jgi:hypothetical protein
MTEKATAAVAFSWHRSFTALVAQEKSKTSTGAARPGAEPGSLQIAPRRS